VKLFGAQHYDKYEFLLSLSDQMGGIGLEHHRSSEDGVKLGYFLKWKDGPGSRNLLPHEYTHSWDGKYRRGADLWTPDYRTPMRGSLLWVYEGQTQFWGYVLQARSGLVSKQDTLDMYASIMAHARQPPGAQLAQHGRHHQRSRHLAAPAQGLAEQPAVGGLLQ
jgi:predicted metalloprotease with PDZ domain